MSLKDSAIWQPHRAAASIEPLPARDYVPVLQASLPLLRRLGGSFFVGLFLGLIWALLVIQRRPPQPSGVS